MTSYFRWPKYLVWVFEFKSKSATDVYYSAFASKFFTPAGHLLNISDYRNIDYRLFWFNSGSLGLACTIVLLRPKFPNLPLWNVTFQIYKISTMIFFIRFPKPKAGGYYLTIASKKFLACLRRASLSSYVSFQISKYLVSVFYYVIFGWPLPLSYFVTFSWAPPPRHDVICGWLLSKMCT